MSDRVYKRTRWIRLPFSECTVIQDLRAEREMIRIKHPLLPGTRWFMLSMRGNYYSRYTGRAAQDAEGYIIDFDA